MNICVADGALDILARVGHAGSNHPKGEDLGSLRDENITMKRLE